MIEKMTKKRKDRIMGVTVSLTMIVVCLIIGEFILGFILPDWGTFRYQADEDIGFRLEPSEKAMVNEAGFRDYTYTLRKPKNVYRIVGIGDSQTASCGFTDISNAYLKVLEKNLNSIKGLGMTYEVLNMGVPNYTPHEYLAMLKKYGIEYGPDLVLVAIYLGNDIQVVPQNRDYIVFDGTLISRRALNLSDRSEFEVKLWKWFHERKLYRVVQRAQYAKIWATYDSTPKRKSNRLSVFMKDEFRTPSEKDDIHQAWTDVQKSIKQIQNVVQEHDVRLLLVMIPDEHQVNKSLRKSSLQHLHSNEENYDFEQWNRRLTSFCEDNKIDVLDLTPGLSKVIQHESLYFKNDIHLNVRGHQLVGEFIQEYLLNRQILSASLHPV